MKFQLTESQKRQINKINTLEKYIKNVERSINQLKEALAQNPLLEHIVDMSLLVPGRHIKYTVSNANGLEVRDGYIIDIFIQPKPDSVCQVVNTKEELINSDYDNVIRVQINQIVKTLDLVKHPNINEPYDVVEFSHCAIASPDTVKATLQAKRNGPDGKWFDDAHTGKYYVTGYKLDNGFDNDRDPFVSKAFNTIEEARKALYQWKKVYIDKGYTITHYTQESFNGCMNPEDYDSPAVMFCIESEDERLDGTFYDASRYY